MTDRLCEDFDRISHGLFEDADPAFSRGNYEGHKKL
jgi:hypothetical protein